jgi:hypothetical protein
MRTTRLASSQEAFEKRGWAVHAPIFNRLRRRKEFATTGRQDARLLEDITASRIFAMPKSCYRGLAEGSGKALADGRRFQDYRAYRIRWVVFIKRPNT